MRLIRQLLSFPAMLFAAIVSWCAFNLLLDGYVAEAIVWALIAWALFDWGLSNAECRVR